MILQNPLKIKEDPTMIANPPPPRFHCDYCGWLYPLDSLQETEGGACCPDCTTFLQVGIDPRPWCAHCGRSLPPGATCPCLEPQDYVCAECGQIESREDLYLSLDQSRSLCPVCWLIESQHKLISDLCRMMTGLVDLLEEIDRQQRRGQHG